MAAYRRELSEGNVYHVYARGVGRILLYEDDRDREAFLAVLERRLGKTEGSLLAWCLMGNHYHLLVRMPMGELSELVRVTNMTYAQRFNERYDRAGHLFQGRFGSQPIASDEQLLCAARYIHRNPDKARIEPADRYPWSSYGEYLGRPSRVGAPALCDTGPVLGLLGGSEGFARFHREPGDGGFAFLDSDSPRGKARTMSDEEAIETGSSLLGERWREAIAGLGKPERDHQLRILLQAGLSIRQLERLTGIGRGIIARA